MILEKQPSQDPLTDEDEEELYNSMKKFADELEHYATEPIDVEQLHRTQSLNTSAFRHCMKTFDKMLEFMVRHECHRPKEGWPCACAIPAAMVGVAKVMQATEGVPAVGLFVLQPLFLGFAVSAIVYGIYTTWETRKEASKAVAKWKDINETIEIYFKDIQKTMRVYYILASALPIPRDIANRRQWIDKQMDQHGETLLADIKFPGPDDPNFCEELSEQFRLFFENIRGRMEKHLAKRNFQPHDQSADGESSQHPY
jgi:hypothetical protein